MRKKMIAMVMLFIMCLGLLPNVAVAAATLSSGSVIGSDSEIKSGAVYHIYNVATGNKLSIVNNGDQVLQGTQNTQWKLNFESTNNSWRHAAFSFISVKYQEALTLPEYDLRDTDSEYVIGREYDGSATQMFKLNRYGSGTGENAEFYITNVGGRALAASENSNDIVMQPFTGSTNERWRVERVDGKMSHFELVKYWAPEVYQDIYNWPRYYADYFTNFDYDYNWKGNDNYDHLSSYQSRLYAWAYYSIQETKTHYYLTYNFYHPVDLGPFGNHKGNIKADSHENDMEAILLVIRKGANETGPGTFEIMETVSHSHYHDYTNNSSITNGLDDFEGKVVFTENESGKHPRIKITSNGVGEGHGHGIISATKTPGDGGIKYVLSDTNEAEKSHFNRHEDDDNYDTVVKYGLKNIDELWERRNAINNGDTFGKFGTFDGNDFRSDAANAPWNWQRGLWLSDPAYTVDRDFNNIGPGDFSHTYTFNKYFTHKITIKDLTCTGVMDKKRSNAADMYVELRVNGTKYFNYDVWQYNNIRYNQKVKFTFGGDGAKKKNDGFSYRDKNVNTIYVARPDYSNVHIKVYDNDSNDDDYMGEIKINPDKNYLNPYTILKDKSTSNGKAKVSMSVVTRY